MDPTQIIEVRNVPSHAGVSIKLTRSVQGVSLEVDVNRLREPHESYDHCAQEAARLMVLAFSAGEQQAAHLGLTLGKDKG